MNIIDEILSDGENRVDVPEATCWWVDNASDMAEKLSELDPEFDLATFNSRMDRLSISVKILRKQRNRAFDELLSRGITEYTVPIPEE